MVTSYAQLSPPAGRRGRPCQAQDRAVWHIALLLARFPQRLAGAGPWHSRRLTAQLSTGTLEAGWRSVLGSPWPRPPTGYLSSSHLGAGELAAAMVMTSLNTAVARGTAEREAAGQDPELGSDVKVVPRARGTVPPPGQYDPLTMGGTYGNG
jgi:hypothetical protein